MAEQASIKAIELTRKVFEHIHGNIGLLRFNVEELNPTNGNDAEESKKWKIVCSFYETLGSTKPSTFEVNVDLTTNTVRFHKIAGLSVDPNKDEGSYTVKREESKP